MLLAIAASLAILSASALCLETPVTVSVGSNNNDLNNPKQIIRTSTGRIYYFSGNGSHTTLWDGWIDVNTSVDGHSWTKDRSQDQYYTNSGIAVAIDATNVIHMVTYDWNNHPTYQKFNTADSAKGDHSWEGYELLESAKSATTGKCALAIDANGGPHVVYKLLESYKGKNYTTLTYANSSGGTWHKIAVWPKENKINSPDVFDIAIGPDNIPYILIGSKALKGNANNPTAFETKDLGGGYSFVIHQNGDVRVALPSNSKYAHYLHDHTQLWSAGWTLSVSGSPDSGGVLVLANDVPYLAKLLPDGIWIQKNFDPPLLAVPQPSGVTWQSLTTRWSFYNNNVPGAIDLGTRSWLASSSNFYWYARYASVTAADFSAAPDSGLGPLSVNFTDNSRAGEGRSIVSWEWEFNNDGIVDTTVQNPVFKFDKAGKYPVSLKVTDSAGEADRRVKQDFIEVVADSDGDGIPDPQDNCPFDYNPLQTDLNSNGIGDVCEPPFNRLQKANFMTRLRSMTAADRNMQDVTGIMTDSLLNQGVTLSSPDNNMVSIQLNKDALDIKKLILRMYINGITPYNPLNAYVYIMPYSSDLKTTVDAGLSGGWNGWNEIDLTSLMHRMDGYGAVKFRIAALRQSTFNIYEIGLTEKADAKEIGVAPEAVDFGTVTVTKNSLQNITVSNSGAESLSIVKIVEPSQPFSIVSDECSGKTLPTNGSCIITTSFAPGRDGQYNDVIVIDSNDADNSSKKISLQGTAQLAFTGVVTDVSSGQPLNSVTVKLIDSSMKTFEATTDFNGEYTIMGVTPGSFSANLSRFDYVARVLSGTIYQSQINRADAQLSYNGASISGTVTEPLTGAPVAGVNVTLTLSGIKTADLAAFCNDTPLITEDHKKILENDGNKFSCNNIVFKTRNPNGTNEPFTPNWNGIGSRVDGTEYLAQRFKPAKTGKLTKVSINSNWFSDKTVGEIHVLLKSSLGGDRGTYLAKSNINYFDALRLQTTTWIDFTFPDPPMVTAGEEYYIEINGSYYESGDFIGFETRSLYDLSWISSDSYPNGKAYQRNSGFWIELPSSLAFSTFIDGQPDIVTVSASNSFSMYGGNWVSVGTSILNQVTGVWDRSIPMSNGSNGSDGFSGYNGDDLTAKNDISDFQPYYDSNHWVTVKTWSDSNTTSLLFGGVAPSALLTDQFFMTFSRTLSSVTDANGIYSFSALPGSDYSIHFNKPGYYSTASGSLIFGQQKSLDVQLSSIPLPSVSITSPLNGSVFSYSRYITVTGNVSSNATVTVNGMTATVYNGIYTVSIYIGNSENTVTAIAKDQYGQTALSTITVIVPTAPIITNVTLVNITADSAIVQWSTDHASSSHVDYGETNGYGSSMHDDALVTTHSISVTGIKPSTTYHFRVSSTNKYQLSSTSEDFIFTTPQFTAKTIGYSGNVTVMETIGNYDAKNPDGSINDQPRQAIAREYFKAHGDVDFLVYLSTFDYAMCQPTALGFYNTVRNETLGINQPIMNISAAYGSSGMIQGTIDMGNVTSFASNPYGPKLEEVLNTLGHELMHRFGAFVRFKNPDGTLNTGLLGKDGSHWSYLLDTQGSLMLGNAWKDNGDGTFTSSTNREIYSPLDLYLMGMIPKEQVPPMLLIDNPAIDKTKLPELGATITGTAQTVTIDDIIAAEGVRIPDSTQSQKQFTIGYVLLTRAGDSLGNAPQAIDTLRKAFSGKLVELTQGKGSIGGIAPSLEVLIDSPADSATLTGPDVTVSGALINTAGAETGVVINGVVATVSGRHFIANHVPLQQGANIITVTATDANGLTATATRSVTANPGHYIRITSNIESGTAPLEVSLRIDGSFTVTKPQISATGNAAMEWLPSISPTEYGAKITSEGTIAFTASAIGPDGQTYSDSVTITAISMEKIDNLLRSKWNSINSNLANGNIPAALNSFHSTSKENYQAIFDEVGPQLPTIIASHREFNTVRIEEGIVLYELVTLEEDGLHTFDIVFVQDDDGLWRIRSY